MTDGDAALDLAHPSTAPKPLARVYGEPVNELPQDLYIPPEALEVFLETFEGPLDLLLYLIRRQNINVLDIPMAELTRQYLGYVEMMRRTQLELARGLLHLLVFEKATHELGARIFRLLARRRRRPRQQQP